MVRKEGLVITSCWQIISSIIHYILNGVLYTIVTNLYKPFAQKFIFRLEGSEFHVSIFNALPGMVAAFAIIPGIIYMSRTVSKKKVIGIFFFLSRLFIPSFALVPFLPEMYKPMVFVLLAGFMNFPGCFNNSTPEFCSRGFC